jgi:hypothetical protein
MHVLLLGSIQNFNTLLHLFQFKFHFSFVETVG